MPLTEPGRRLCLLFQAGGCRCAVEATSVIEVAAPDATGRSIRGSLELKDLSTLLGGAPEAGPGMGVVLDVSPTLAVRVGSIEGVTDVSGAPFFQLPRHLGDAWGRIIRGALLHQGKLFLELGPDALPHAPRPLPPRARAPRPGATLADQALVFQSQGRDFAVPMGWVSQIVPASEAFCPLPGPPGAAVGVSAHAGSLWPVVSLPAFGGAAAEREALLILTELAGEHVAWSASRVIGVHSGFVPAEGPGEFRSPSSPRPVLFLDLQEMFS